MSVMTQSQQAEREILRRAQQFLDSIEVKEAEALATSTEWGPTSGEYRDLMQKWKAAGPAPRTVVSVMLTSLHSFTNRVLKNVSGLAL